MIVPHGTIVVESPDGEEKKIERVNSVTLHDNGEIHVACEDVPDHLLVVDAGWRLKGVWIGEERRMVDDPPNYP